MSDGSHPRVGARPSRGSRRLPGALLGALALLAAAAAPVAGGAEVTTLAVPATGAYTGAYIDFGATEDEVTLEKIQEFAQLVGKHQAIVAFSNHWGSGAFPLRQARIVQSSGAVPFILWYPWQDPNHKEEPRFALERILAGDFDAYIDAWARDAHTLGRPLLVSFGLEMNGDWYPWSGYFHGSGMPVAGSSPPAFAGPDLFRRAYRHVVDRARAAGGDNLLWVFHVNNFMFPWQEWNRMREYYPGPEYVDWIGMSAYGKQFPGEEWFTFDDTLVEAYDELAALDPAKPLMLAEWSTGEFPHEGNKGDFIRDAFEQMPKLPRLKAAVFWHERWQNADLSYSNLRVTSSIEALKAYRRGVASPFWIGEPVYRNTSR